MQYICMILCLVLWGGVYSVSDIHIDALLCGGEGENSLDGKVEEFAFWKKDIGLATIQNYQMNQTGMIGGDIGDQYESEVIAKDDGLKYYYSFDNTSVLIPNYTDISAPLLKSKSMPVSGGKHKNATSINNGYMTLERMTFEEEFTLNIRFYLDQDTDFLLFENAEALKIRYDASNRVFQIDFSPYIGNKKIFMLEYPSFRVHSWYDFSVRYKDGVMSAVINGIEVETFYPASTIGGCKRTAVDFTNIEKVTVFSGSGVGIVSPRRVQGQSEPHTGQFISATQDSESLKMVASIYHDEFNSSFNGKSNAMALIFNKEHNKLAGLSINVAETDAPTITVMDSVTNDISIHFSAAPSSYLDSYSYGWTFTEQPNLDQFSVEVTHDGGGSSYYGSIRNSSMLPNALIPGMPILLELQVKDIVVSQENVFPKLTIFPGTRIKVVKKEMSPPLLEDAIAELHIRSRSRIYYHHIYGDLGEIIVAINKETGRAYASVAQQSCPYIGLGLRSNGYVLYFSRDSPVSYGGNHLNTDPFVFKRLKNW